MFDILVCKWADKTTLPKHTQYTGYNNTHPCNRKTYCRTRHKLNTFGVVKAIVCDYTDFDFTWNASTWEADQVHCWSEAVKQQSGQALF